jgi:hypothetical protein
VPSLASPWPPFIMNAEVFAILQRHDRDDNPYRVFTQVSEREDKAMKQRARLRMPEQVQLFCSGPGDKDMAKTIMDLTERQMHQIGQLMGAIEDWSQQSFEQPVTDWTRGLAAAAQILFSTATQCKSHAQQLHCFMRSPKVKKLVKSLATPPEAEAEAPASLDGAPAESPMKKQKKAMNMSPEVEANRKERAKHWQDAVRKAAAELGKKPCFGCRKDSAMYKRAKELLASD